MPSPQGTRETEEDRRLAEAVVRLGLITPAQLDDALADPSALPLAEILLQKGYLSEAHLGRILEEEDHDSTEEEGPGEPEMRLGHLLVLEGAVAEEHVEECLREQEEQAAAGREAPRLGELLVRRGFCSSEQVEAALELQEASGKTCADCGKHCAAILLDMGDSTACPYCGAPFPETTRAPIASIPAPREKPRPSSRTRLRELRKKRRRPPPPEPLPAPAKPVPPELRTLGKYLLRAELGRGAMGVVYEAVDDSLGRKVALKLVTPAAGAGDRESPEEVERFVKEARLCAALPKHPNIVTVYEAGALSGRHYLAMELIEGRPFSTWRRKASVTVRHQVRLLRDVALAVHHAHEHGVLHCDLKPQNVMIDANRRPYVTDFGLARRLGVRSTVAASGYTVGTPAYMSPEQAQGFKNLDRRTDIYSLGVMLYEAFTGRLPFRAATPEQMLERVVHDPVRPPSGLARSLAATDRGRAVDSICLRALAKKPQNRYPTARALAEDLTRWLKRQPVGGAGTTRPGTRPWRATATAAGILLAAALVLGLTHSAPDFSPRLERAEQMLAKQDLAGARAGFEKVLDDDPLNEAAREGLSRVRAREREAQLAARQRDLDKDRADFETDRRRRAASTGSREPLEWLVAGPFENRGIEGPHAPEAAIDPSAEMRGKHGPVRWEPKIADLRSAGTSRASVFDFNALFVPQTTQVVAYAVLHIKAPVATKATLLVGSDDGVKIWLNGTVVHTHEIGRGVRIDEDVVPIRLRPGWNRLLFKVTQWGGGWGLAARVADPDLRPIEGLEYDAYGDLPRPARDRGN